MASPDIVTVCGNEIRLTDNIDNIIHSIGDEKIRNMMKPADRPDNAIVNYSEFVSGKVSKIIFGFKENAVMYNDITSGMFADEIKEILDGKCAVLRHNRFKEIYTIYHILFRITKDGRSEEINLDDLPVSLKNGCPENISQFEYDGDMTKFISDNIPKGGCILHYMISCKNERSKGFISAEVCRRKNIFKGSYNGNAYKKIIQKG
ncbi:MAG: hypothetical protein ACI4RG_00810 [Huintestinicola sp.]